MATAMLPSGGVGGSDAKGIAGHRGIELSRADGEVACVTIVTVDDLASVPRFQGRNYARCHAPDAARALLSRFDGQSAHDELTEAGRAPWGIGCVAAVHIARRRG